MRFKYSGDNYGFLLLLGSSGGMAFRVSLLVYVLIVEMFLFLKFSECSSKVGWGGRASRVSKKAETRSSV